MHKFRFPSAFTTGSTYQIWLKSDKIEIFADFSAPWWGYFSTNCFSFTNFVVLALRIIHIKYEANLTGWFMRRRFFKIYQIYPFLETPSGSHGYVGYVFYQMVEIYLVVLEKNSFNVDFYVWPLFAPFGDPPIYIFDFSSETTGHNDHLVVGIRIYT